MDLNLVSAFFLNTGAFYSISHVLVTQALKTQTNLPSSGEKKFSPIWSQMQVECMLVCLQLLGMGNAADQVDSGIIDHVNRIVDTCIHTLSAMN